MEHSTLRRVVRIALTIAQIVLLVMLVLATLVVGYAYIAS